MGFSSARPGLALVKCQERISRFDHDVFLAVTAAELLDCPFYIAGT
jgi:hypothetical protein